MHIPKKYLHDRLVLLTISVNIFLTVLGSLLILLRLGSRGGSPKLVQFRPNLGLSGHTYSSSSSVYISFIIFALIVLVFHTILSIRVYGIRRYFAITVLGLGTLLLILSVIVSNALMLAN